MGTGYDIVTGTPSVEDYNRVRGAAGLRTKDPAAVRIGLGNSVFAVCAEADGEVVGFGRVIGEGALFFEVVDVAVLPEHQGNGLGDASMGDVMRYLNETALPGSFVGIFAGRGVSGFLERHGFRVRDQEAPGMYTVVE